MKSAIFFSPHLVAFQEALTGNRRLQAALACVTAAVVGVILNLAVFFGGRVLIRNDGAMDSFALVMALLSFFLIWRFRLPIHLLVPGGGVIGIAWSVLF